ncbi:E3 ubiquitin-protein ligase WAVH1-like isoform X1 [Abrus precatorius]|uniref:E3 ubiquitin-protein ligase WAVH1-like isoform X1 n=1 Tax=Abrus precatorius TaxID=3816 RepID=A0A8B8M3T5_ABRPR|nr:E3 ubiquitin-protein ligase WAVH1-like isoform X1 [Abrus precatorius]
MVTGWRRAFCTSIPKDREAKVLTEKQQHCDTNNSPKITSKFGFFSNPSTPRCESQPVSGSSLRCRTTCSVPNSPKLQCNNPKTPRLFHNSNPSSPKSPSSFSLLKATLRLSKSRCGICMQSVKSGQGTAIFTAECSHTFHFPCIATHAKKHPVLVCPVCSTSWKELPVLSIHNDNNRDKRNFKVYNDDEPLMSPTSLSRFNPIPESENEDEDNAEFQGFNVNPVNNLPSSPIIRRNLELSLLPEAAIVAANKNYETYVVVLKLKPPQSLTSARRAPIDLVAVLNVGGAMSGHKLRLMKNSMRQVISSLGSTDRLSIVAFSAGSKRLLPLRRMTGGGQRSARRIVDALAPIDQSREGAPVRNDALKKAAKVLEDRRVKNAVASIIILSDIHDSRAAACVQKASLVSTTRLAHLEVPVHAVRFPSEHALPDDDALAKCVGGLLSVVAQDVRIQLGVVSRSRPVDIAAVYSLAGRPAALGSGSIRLGDLYAEEERELLVELKVPAASAGSHHVLTVRSSYRDPLTREVLNPVEQAMLVPRPHTVRSSCPKIERLRNLHVTARAVAESSRLVEHNDLSGAHHLLSSARALLLQSGTPAEDYLRWLEAELAELQRRRQQRMQGQQRQRNSRAEEKLEPLTPTSAWRAAERLAKVAIMRKSMNRVSDLHGFENARF